MIGKLYNLSIALVGVNAQFGPPFTGAPGPFGFGIGN